MTKTTENTKTNIPELRFPEFSGVWKEKEFGDVATFSKGKGIPKNDIVQGGKNKCIRYGELYTDYKEIIDIIKSKTDIEKENSILSQVDNLLVPSSGETNIDIATVSCVKERDVILGGDLNIVRLEDDCYGDFFAYYLSNYKKNDLARFGQGHSVVHLYASHFKNLKINIPQKAEQQKIASFLGRVDTWIENLEGQKENLEKYKKGLMQKIFSQEIRFKNENGKSFPDWEEKKLREAGERFNGLTGKTKEDFGFGKKFITYKQIFDHSEIDTKNCLLVDIDENERQNMVRFGDVLFTTSSETPLEVGFSSVLFGSNEEIYLNSFSFGFRPNSLDELHPNFSKFFFRSPIFRREMVRLAQGSTRYNMSKLAFMKIEIRFPSLPEQQKIADFLSSVDELIQSKNDQITRAKNWKKGLMQKMFI